MADTLSPEDQAFIANLHKSGGVAPPPIAQSDWYQKLAQPVTRAAAHVISGVRDIASNIGPYGSNDPAIAQALEKNVHTPAEQLTPFARDFWEGGISPMSVAETVVPQTKTAAAIDLASFALPEAKGLEMMGHTLGPMSKLLGSRLGRMGALTATGAGAGALTGEGALAGAGQGFLSSLPEPVTALTGAVGRHLGAGKLEKETSEGFAQAIKRRMPWIGKLDDGRDFALQFSHGQARQAAGRLLTRVKDDIGNQVRGYDFAVGLPKAFSVLNPQAPVPARMSFHELDNLITELQQGLGFTAAGTERSGVSGRGARILAHKLRDTLADDLNKVKSGLGTSYLRARKKFDITRTMEDIFSDPKLLTRHGLDQGLLLKKLDEYAEDLDRGMGKDAARGLQDLLRRGFGRQVSDIPGEAGRGHLVVGPAGLPHYRAYPGTSPQPVGAIPGYMRPSSKKYEAVISNLIGRARGTNAEPRKVPVPAIKPTERADIRRDLTKGKTPDVTSALRSGKLKPHDIHSELERRSGDMAG